MPDALMVDGDEVELIPDPPWQWLAPFVRLKVSALNPRVAHSSGLPSILEADIKAAAPLAAGQAYMAPGFSVPGTIVSCTIEVLPNTLSEAVFHKGEAVATIKTEGTFIATPGAPAMAPPPANTPDPVLPKTGTWRVVTPQKQNASVSGTPAAKKTDGQAAGVSLIGEKIEREVHFVAVELEDTDGNKLASSRITIETPDQAQHTRTLTAAGAARVDGIRAEGDAIVRMSQFDFVPPVVRKGQGNTWIAFTIIDELGRPVPLAEVEITTPDGQVIVAQTGPKGALRIDGLKEEGECEVKVRLPQAENVDGGAVPGGELADGGAKGQSGVADEGAEGQSGVAAEGGEGQRGLADEARRGGLHVRLLDKSGRVAHANMPYIIAGPVELGGTTDSEGNARHEDVPAGDYQLHFTLSFFEGSNEVIDEHSCAVIVQPAEATPQVRMIGARPRLVMARLRGLLFDKNKAFLLPSALGDLRDKIRPIYEANSPGELLVVGHTDTTADASVNDPLSLERAKSMVAYLKDDVDAWLAFYETSIPKSRRWGAIEDGQMLLSVLSEEEQQESGTDLVSFFQQKHDLQVDGVIGPETRTRLIKEYMLLDGAELDDAKLRIHATAHGCGENFPVDESGFELDGNAQDNSSDALDRRVELFFFDSDFGIVPPPPGENSSPGSTEYIEWRERAELIEEIQPPPLKSGERFAVRLLDTRGRGFGEGTVSFTVSVDGQRLASGGALDSWAVFDLPALVNPVVDIVWGTAESNVRFARRIDLTSARPAEGALSAARLGALGFPVREDGLADDSAAGYQRLYELDDPNEAVINHLNRVFDSEFEAPHPETEDDEVEDEGEFLEDEDEIERPEDDGPDEALDDADAARETEDDGEEESE